MKITKYHIFAFIIGAVIFSSINGVLAYKLFASQVGYEPDDNNWNVNQVDTAIDDLYDMSMYGDATSSEIKDTKKALVGGNEITGSLSIPTNTDLSGTQNINPGSSSTTLNGNYNMNNYNVSCASCPSSTNISGTTTIAPSGSTTALNGLYNVDNYNVACSSCAAGSLLLSGKASTGTTITGKNGKRILLIPTVEVYSRVPVISVKSGGTLVSQTGFKQIASVQLSTGVRSVRSNYIIIDVTDDSMTFAVTDTGTGNGYAYKGAYVIEFEQ